MHKSEGKDKSSRLTKQVIAIPQPPAAKSSTVRSTSVCNYSASYTASAGVIGRASLAVLLPIMIIES